MREAGTEKLPALKLADGRVLIHQRTILGWIGENERQLRSGPLSS
jgi:hypothetical protein